MMKQAATRLARSFLARGYAAEAAPAASAATDGYVSQVRRQASPEPKNAREECGVIAASSHCLLAPGVLLFAPPAEQIAATTV